MSPTAAELAQARIDAEHYLPSTAAITRGSITDDQGGGGTINWQSRATVACRLAPVSGREGEFGGRMSEDSDWVITLPALTQISLDERLEIDGETYRVMAIRERDFEVTRRVEAKRTN